jgi:2',3'-cyclic-nucleotide 2'-phosphodiesterase/3'-nucleotidase
MNLKLIFLLFMRMKKVLFIISIFTFLTCCSTKKPEEFKLTLVETSDVHGAIFKYDFIYDRPSAGSLSQVYEYVTNLRKEQNVILMDNGDILQGQPVVYYYNYENKSGNHICSDVMNYMKYDVATIGNHDIEAGHDVYDKLKKEYDFPWLAANAIDINTNKPYFKPFTIIEKQGFKIAILGLITPGIPKWLPEELWSGMRFDDMLVTAKKYMPIIQKENPDVVVGLFHSGYDFSYGGGDYNSEKNENASKIVAEQVPGFDVVFVGHDHETWNEKIVNNNGDTVLVLGPQSSARQVATAEIYFKKNAHGKYQKNITGEIVDITKVEPNDEFDNYFNSQYNIVKEFVSHKVGEFNETINTHEAIYGPSRFIDFLNGVQLELSNANISFAAPLSFGTTIEKGPVYVRDMFKLYRYENFLYTIELSGAEIDSYLEYSIGNWFNTMENQNDNLLLFAKNSDGSLVFSNRTNSYRLENRFYDFDVAAGIHYEVDLTKPANERVNIISTKENQKFYLDSIYSVAINSYRGNGGGGHLTVGAGLSKHELAERRISSTEKDIRYFLMKWIEDNKTIEPEFRNEWTILPEEWWYIAKENDKKLLNTKK